ncbi:MAG: hypothetical protein ACKVZH_06155 [Blastocatellia bacterium]
MKSLLVGIKNIILWSYERGTWQYDVMCLLIISAVFLVPSKYFGDRDRPRVQSVSQSIRTIAQANGIRVIASEPSEPDETVLEVPVTELQLFLNRLNKPELMLNAPNEAIRLYLGDRLKQDVVVSKFEPFIASPNSQGRVSGYKVWIK